MTDEIERCTAAGMDCVLAKPLELPRLCEVLDRYGFRSSAPAPERPRAAAAVRATYRSQRCSRRSPWTWSSCARIVGDDRDFMNELCETFVSSSTRIVEELTRALSAGDRAVLSAMAHKLKGGSASICAHELAKLAATLEKDAKEKPHARAAAVGGCSAPRVRRRGRLRHGGDGSMSERRRPDSACCSSRTSRPSA